MKNVNKVIMNSLLGGVIAMGFGATGAFADEAKTTATEQASSATQPANVVITRVNDTAPAVVPGNPFYFLKLFVEKIEVILKTGDTEKAKLLATQVKERLSEASVLFDEGKTDLAMETLNKALLTQDQAVETAGAPEAVVKPAVTIERVGASATGHADDEDKDEDKDEAADHEKADQDELEQQLRHNIEALTKALEHVKNPTARAALARNIEKTLAKAQKAAERSEEADDATASGVTITVVGKEQATDDDRDDDHERTAAKAEDKSAREQAKAAKKGAHEQAMAEKKAAHEQAKAEHKQEDRKQEDRKQGNHK